MIVIVIVWREVNGMDRQFGYFSCTQIREMVNKLWSGPHSKRITQHSSGELALSLSLQ